MSNTKKLKVALCTDGVYPQAMGGMQRHSRLLAQHLARTGKIELHVIHPHVLGIFSAEFNIQEHLVAPIDEDRIYLLELKRYSRNVADCLDEINPDVVMSQGFSLWVDTQKWGERAIVHPHGLEMFQMITKKEQLLGYPFRRSLRSIIRNCNTVVSLGGKLTSILSEQVKGSACEVITIPNAVDIPETPPEYPSEHVPLRLFFVGRFAFNKGIDVLLKVAARFVAEGDANIVQFDLAGDGPLMKEIKEAGVPHNVSLKGRVNDDELEELYGCAHALVLPTRFEGMPTVVLEAMARKRPILVSDVGATAEQVSPHNGYLLPSGDEEALYQAIRSMLERKPEVWEKMGAYSRDRAKELFSWPAVTERYIELFERVAIGAAPRPQ